MKHRFRYYTNPAGVHRPNLTCGYSAVADKAEEIRKLMPAQIRLDFTVENKEQVREICKIYMNAFTEGKKMEPQIREYTRGHFKRGVK